MKHINNDNVAGLITGTIFGLFMGVVFSGLMIFSDSESDYKYRLKPVKYTVRYEGNKTDTTFTYRIRF
jgi:hypothetical protein